MLQVLGGKWRGGRWNGVGCPSNRKPLPLALTPNPQNPVTLNLV
jgi:hypothetical protein